MVNMRAPSFIRSLSSKLSMGRRSMSPTIVPEFEQTQFSQQVVTLLATFQSSKHTVGSSTWLVHALDATIAAQKLAHQYLIQRSCSTVSYDNELVDQYLEDNVELLDACNALVEKVDTIQNYVASVRSTARLVSISDHANSPRVKEMLNKCDKLEKQCKTLDKCCPKLHKLMGRKTSHQPTHAWDDGQHLELNEAVKMSKEVALLTCHRLQRALSFKSKQSLMSVKSNVSTNWSHSLNGSSPQEDDERRKACSSSPNSMMKELEQVITTFRVVHDQVMKTHKVNSCDVDLLRRSCDELEQGMRPLEEQVRELYRHLISIRMALLGILSQT